MNIYAWGIIAILGIGIVAGVGFYIKDAEENRQAVIDLKADKKDLEDANLALAAAAQKTSNALQDAITESIEREKKYVSSIEEIRRLPDSGCVRNSPALRASLRMLGNKPGGKAPDASGSGGADKAHAATAGTR